MDRIKANGGISLFLYRLQRLLCYVGETLVKLTWLPWTQRMVRRVRYAKKIRTDPSTVSFCATVCL